MGNSCTYKGKVTKLKYGHVGIITNNQATTHEGIMTVDADNVCDFSRSSDLCVSIVTWNMNGKVIYDDLERLVGTKRKFDLLVIGLQEAPRSNISRLLEAALVESHILLGKTTMQSLQLFVFGPKKSELSIEELKVDKHGVGGFGGMIRRKKGGVAISFTYKGIRMVFISCHLSAHGRNVEERNRECRHISHALFAKNRNPYSRSAQITIWLGDLNYRLQGITTHPARNLIQQDLHQLLTRNDQLLQEAERGQIFNGYCEGTLTFKPTYKYNVGSNNYDTSHKVRVPSWTDRILFRVNDPDNIDATLHTYESIDRISSSDHKPVKAHLCLKINKSSSLQSLIS